MPRWWDTLKAVWDNAGQLVQLREDVDTALHEVTEMIGTLQADVNKLNERTRKQVYRGKDEAYEEAIQSAQQAPRGRESSHDERSAVLKAARARGLIN